MNAKPSSPRLRRHALLALLGLSLALLGSACSDAPPDVDRVEPNLIDKSMFEGEWWSASTIIDVDYDTAFIFGGENASGPFKGAMSSDFGLDYNRLGGAAQYSSGSFPIGRIRWVIEEDFLFAFRTYELTAGGNDRGADPGFRGQPLAVYAIEEHVDVRQDYNSVTGETTNVREENTSDRRWFEREFMRIDWSNNQITNFNANDVQINELFASFSRDSVSFDIEEVGGDYPDSYRPMFVTVGEDPDYRRADEWPEDAADTTHYMSFVNREVWTPGSSCRSCTAVNVLTRNSFLRVPPNHEYAAAKSTHREFDRFGFFRALQPTYIRGGEDKTVQAVHCDSDADCGAGGHCEPTTGTCAGGLTSDFGETDALTFYMSRHNLYADSLTDQSCVSDWECNGRHDEGDDVDKHGSTCDPVARRCTLPLRARPIKPVEYTLSAHFPPYLVRSAFRTVADWNEALMRGRRAVLADPAHDQFECDEGICTQDLNRQALRPCQQVDPTSPCFCGSLEVDAAGNCGVRYDPFESPVDAEDRGVRRPYDCYVEGPADIANPVAYDEYSTTEDYGYRFVGSECILTLEVNDCDIDAEAPCQQLGDLRYQFLNHIEHGATPFGGVAVPLSDPTTGELVVSNANVASEALESMAKVTSEFYPVLRGEADEDEYFSGEHVRGYFARAGRVEHPVGVVSLGADGTYIEDPDRPALGGGVQSMLESRFEGLSDRIASLRGSDGRASIYTDRLQSLADSEVGRRLEATVQSEQDATQSLAGETLEDAPRSILEGGPLQDTMDERRRLQALASRNIDVMRPGIYHSQYHRYWADAFEDRPVAEASMRMQQGIFRSVMWHELGHALGLRHNFAASLDRDHYKPAYYNLARDTPLPHHDDYDSPAFDGDGNGVTRGEESQRWARAMKEARQERQTRGAGNYMTSSVMDYNGDLSDLSGLGDYDRAAVLFGYFNHVEAYSTGDPEVDPAAVSAGGLPSSTLDGLQYSDAIPRALWRYYSGGESCEVNADCPHASGKETVAFQDIRQRCVVNPRDQEVTGVCDGQEDCVCSNFYDDFDAYGAGAAYRDLNTDPTWSQVDYLFCQDGRINDLSWCTPFDAGESFLEVVEHYRQRWQDNYPARYFRNYRAGGPNKGYASGSIIDATKIYQHFVFRNFYEAGFRGDPGALGYLDHLFASVDVFNWLVSLVGAPDVGSYSFDAADNTYRQMSSSVDADGADVSLYPGQGYYMWSQYQEGLNGFFRLERAGMFLDKLAAMEALTRRDWGLSYGLDERLYVNFYDLFSTEVVDVFGGLMLRKPEQYAPRVTIDDDGEPQLSYLSMMGALYSGNETNAEAFPQASVDGIDSEALRAFASTLALASFPVYYDTSFEQRLLIFKLGSGEGYALPQTRKDGTPVCAYDGGVTCENPDYIVYESERLHTSYVGVIIGGASDNEQVAYRLLLTLQQKQERLTELGALGSPTFDELDEIERLRRDIERDEGFVEYLIELSRGFGISSPF